MRRTELLALAWLVSASCGGGGGGGGGQEPGARRSAVLITLDTTNAAALDVYEPNRGVTPELLRFAGECVVYDDARTVAPLTVPAHASMLTGLYPPRHRVRDNGHLPLPDAADTLAERAQAAGLRTAAFVSSKVLTAAYGLAQGFEVYDEPGGRRDAGRAGVGYLERRGPAVTRAATDWLDGRGAGEAFFLWVHYWDPHAPYDPPADALARAGGRPYLGEVAATDEAIGALLRRLAAEPDYDEMTIVVVADHGEALGRHDEPQHGTLVYDTTLRVPLLVRAPGRARAGERSSATVSVVDVYGTILDGIGLAAPAAIDGTSLLSEPPSAGRGVYFESYYGYLAYGWSPLAGWAEGGVKYLHSTAPELFETSNDPGEERDVFRAGDERVTAALAAMKRVLARPSLERAAEETRALGGAQELSALGYAGVASIDAEIPHPLADCDLPAPRTRTDEYQRVRGAPALVAAGRRSQAIDDLRTICRENPRNALAHDRLAQYLLEDGEAEEALGVLSSLLELGLDRVVLRQHLAQAHLALGNREAALAQLDVADALLPGDPTTARMRAAIEAQ